MSSEAHESGLWELLQKIFVVYFLALGIKRIFVDAPRGIYRYFFVPVGIYDEPEGWQLLLVVAGYYLMFLAVFFVFSLVGLAPVAALALLVSWSVVLVSEFVHRDPSAYNAGPTRFRRIFSFAAKCAAAWFVMYCVVILFVQRSRLHARFPESTGLVDLGLSAATVSICLALFYTKHRVVEKRQLELDTKIRAAQMEDAARKERLRVAVGVTQEFFQDWGSYLYDQEKNKFVDWLYENNFLLSFHEHWDEAYRLHQLGKVTGKYYVCHLWYMTEEQKVAQREAIWRAQRRKQSEHQKAINADERAARLADNPPVQPDPAKLEARALARKEKQQREEELRQAQKKERDEAYMRELKLRGAAGKAAHKAQW